MIRTRFGTNWILDFIITISTYVMKSYGLKKKPFHAKICTKRHVVGIQRLAALHMQSPCKYYQNIVRSLAIFSLLFLKIYQINIW